MKMFVTTVVLGAAIAWPTVGEAAAKKAKVRKASAAVAQQVRAPSNYYGDPRRRPRSSNPAWDVYAPDGTYRGSDPDPLVRMMLHKDNPLHDP